MNTEEENTSSTPTDRRPLGFWLRVVDGLITREFAARFDAEGVDRRDWMLLNAVSGDVDAPWITARLERGGKRVRALVDRGWITQADGSWSLTDDGRGAKERLGGAVDDIRSRVSGAVTPDDYAIMMASLEAIARELGWDETQARERFGRRGFGPQFAPRHGFGRGFGPARGFGHGHGFGPGFAPRHGFGPDHGRADEHGEPCHPHHRGHGHGRRHGKDGRTDERAYERGFDAGFRRGRDAAASESAA